MQHFSANYAAGTVGIFVACVVTQPLTLAFIVFAAGAWGYLLHVRKVPQAPQAKSVSVHLLAGASYDRWAAADPSATHSGDGGSNCGSLSCMSVIIIVTKLISVMCHPLTCVMSSMSSFITRPCEAEGIA